MLTALDKYRTVCAGEAVGMPCPETHLYESLEQAVEVAERLRYPVVDQAALHVGRQGHGDRRRSRRSSRRRCRAIVQSHGAPMLQEYIPGGRRDSVQFVVGRDGAVLFVFHKKRQRTFRRTARFGTVSESASPDDAAARHGGAGRRVGWWGAMGVETIQDPRDGLDKLMEINPRFPRQLWNRTELGINEPLMCLQVARGEPVAPVPPYPLGVLFVEPRRRRRVDGAAAAGPRSSTRAAPGSADAGRWTRPPRRLRLAQQAARVLPDLHRRGGGASGIRTRATSSRTR